MRLLLKITIISLLCFLFSCRMSDGRGKEQHSYNGPYAGRNINRIAFPIGGMGAGMVCLEGSGAISHVSLRHKMQLYNEPCTFAAISIKGRENGAKVLEGPVPEWKIFGSGGTGNGAAGSSFGLPRFDEASFFARFPFGMVTLTDTDVPLDITLTGWSPFIPGDADNSSLPVGALEYRFKNSSSEIVEAQFSYNCKNFMGVGSGKNLILSLDNGFVLWQNAVEESPESEGAFAVFVDEINTTVDHCWFRGGWWDPLTLAWKNIRNRTVSENPPIAEQCPGASVSVPLTLKPGEERTIAVKICWYVPNSGLRYDGYRLCQGKSCQQKGTHKAWYTGQFRDVYEVVEYWRTRYEELRDKTAMFSDTFYSSTLPDEVLEAVSANLTILKSPTVLRQVDGRLWCYEGCSDDIGCCAGSCTHVWNYAQAIPHLFPELERSLRQTEFNESQDDRGHQAFRSNLPIRLSDDHAFHAAADGQLGGIMKVHREWRISGDHGWLYKFWPQVKQSMDYCIETWDPKHKGILEEPHHNTYDIEFWGPDGMCMSFYLGALQAIVKMGDDLSMDVSLYEELFDKGRVYMENELFNGEYFFQKVQWEGLESPDPVKASLDSWTANYSPEAVELLQKEGPKYQYGTGCLSDGVLGFWIARMCGLDNIIDSEKLLNHLKAVHKYNLKHDLSDFANPQRPAFAMGKDGGLLLCTWPNGKTPSLPFVYSNEVWTGIEYQVASHLILEGAVEEGLEIVRVCRDRYDGSIRNPYDEYECGHWYARALASYGLLHSLTGVRYDAVDKALFIDSRIGENFTCFFSCEAGYGSVGLKNGQPFVDMKTGELEIDEVYVSGESRSL